MVEITKTIDGLWQEHKYKILSFIAATTIGMISNEIIKIYDKIERLEAFKKEVETRNVFVKIEGINIDIINIQKDVGLQKEANQVLLEKIRKTADRMEKVSDREREDAIRNAKIEGYLQGKIKYK